MPDLLLPLLGGRAQLCFINDSLENNPMRFYVGNIPYRTTTEELQKLFHPFGTVTSVNIVTDK
ncbi:MAG: hypothetical protein AB1489_28990 [Acidobacteriota bacterium]